MEEDGRKDGVAIGATKSSPWFDASSSGVNREVSYFVLLKGQNSISVWISSLYAHISTDGTD